MAECVVKVEHLKKEYPGVTPLKDVNAEIYRGDVIAVIGPSGTGKSTLLRCINRIEKPTAGRVVVLGQEMSDKPESLSAARKKMGMVFQSFNLFNNLTVLENICAAPIDLKKIPREAAEAKAMELLRKLGLSAKAKCKPSELSGGQKQRIAIARALAMEPEILLLDEPTSALDPKMVQEVLFLIERLAHSGMTMMIVTHELKFARQLSNRVFYMDEGIIYEDGTPEQIFEHPVKEKTKKFIEQSRQFTLSIDPYNLDMDDVLIRLEYFVRNNSLPATFTTKLNSFLEEVVAINILGRNKNIKEVTVLLDAAANTDGVGATLCYGGEEFNPLKGADELSAKLIEHAADCTYSREDGVNIIRAVLR